MFKQLRKFYTSPNTIRFMRISYDRVFGKYLLATNIISTGVLLGTADLIQQEIEFRQKLHEKHYDFQRARRMFVIGLCMGPIHHNFYKYLDRFFPKQNLKTVAKKILIDQIIGSPIFITTFFCGMGLLEGKSLQEYTTELKTKFLTVYMIDWCVWPPTQFINFYFLAPKFRVIYINFIIIFYDIFLSYVKHNDTK